MTTWSLMMTKNGCRYAKPGTDPNDYTDVISGLYVIIIVLLGPMQ